MVVLLTVAALSLAGLPLAAMAAGNVSMSGKVYESAAANTVTTGVVYAVHLTTKQVYQSDQIVSGGEYSLEALPFGYYDIVVVHSSRVYLANRVLNIPAGEQMKVSFVLEEPDPDDTEWWSAAPDRKVPGLERTPDGVARIVEDDRTLALLLGKGAGGSAGAGAAAGSAAAAGAGFWATSGGWLIPLVVATGITAGGIVLTEDNDDAEDEPASRFE